MVKGLAALETLPNWFPITEANNSPPSINVVFKAIHLYMCDFQGLIGMDVEKQAATLTAFSLSS